MRALPHIAENFKIEIVKHVPAIAPTPLLPTPLTDTNVRKGPSNRGAKLNKGQGFVQ